MAPYTIIITMAGQGLRFREAGYQVPKYEIEVKGQTLFHWAISSLQNFLREDCHVVFIARKEFSPEKFIKQECKILGINDYDIIPLDQLTDGQASTVLYAEKVKINQQTPLLIYNIDTHVQPEVLRPEMFRGDGWIPCFPGTGEGWSFVRVDDDNRAVEVREKQRISPHATIGLYGFSSYECYEALYRQYYAKPQNIEMKERYIAPMYNQLIADNQPVYIEILSLGSIYPLGTPVEVDTFSQNSYCGLAHM